MSKSHHTKSIGKNYVHKLLCPSSNFGNLSFYIVTETYERQSVLHNRIIILLNWEKERTSIQFHFLKLNSPSKPFLTSPVKMKKTSTHSKKFFLNQKVPT